MQVLNLAVKLYLTNATQTELLCQYIFSLARYDQNYDIRDRARFLKQFIFPASGQSTILSRNAKKIFLATKPAPLLESKYQGREQYQLGSLSHYLNMKANGYNDIPSFPDVAPDASVRNVESPLETQSIEEPVRMTAKQSKGAAKGKTKSFYSESEKSSSEYSSDSEESDSESESLGENGTNNKTVASTGGAAKKSSSEETEDSESDSDSDSSDGSSSSGSESDDDDDDNGSSSSSSDDDKKPKKLTNHASKPQGNGAKPEKSNLDLLLDLGDITPTGPIMTPSLGGFLTPMTQNASPMGSSNRIELVAPNHIPLNSVELINKVSGYGLGVAYRFTRAPHLFSSSMVSIELQFTNNSNDAMENIKIGDKNLPAGMQLNEFAAISVLPSKATVQGTLGIDFNDSTQPVHFDIVTKTNSCHATIKATVGELIRAVLMSEQVYREQRSKLRGMNEHSVAIPLNTTVSDARALQQRIYEHANVANIPSSLANTLHFAGQTLSSQSLVLVTIEIGDANATIMVNCEKMVVGSMLLNEIKAALRN